MITPVPGKPNLLLGAYDLATLGYGAEEFFVSGTAESYAPPQKADYTTRVVVLAPTDKAAFNGTAIVEWLNVSGGIDAPAVWSMAHREIAREGYAYVMVSAQRVGVEGGMSLLMDMSLKTLDPDRYSRLIHPGDAFSYDIYSQVGRLVREGVFGGFDPKVVLAAGESQSAMFLTTYVNEVDPLAELYDGFLVHSRFGPAAPLDGANMFEQLESEAVPFRADLRVPVLTVITETDLIGGIRAGYHLARQPDNDRLRAWEIPGTAHADNYTIRVGHIDDGSAQLEEIVAAYAPTDMLLGQKLSYSINNSPQHHYVLQAAVAALHRWVRGGGPAPRAPLIELTGQDPPRLVLDGNGLAAGGVRTPWVDVPVAQTSGFGSEESVLAMLFGRAEPFDSATLGRLYPGGAADFLDRFTGALDRAIESGFIVPADRAEILELAAATYPA
jgi:Alpha/beta hydrolase domain